MARKVRSFAPGKPARKPKVHEKRINVELIKPETKEGGPIYELVARTIEKWHEHLTNARIAVAWNMSWKPDADGRVKLGMLRKCSDLDRELAPFDLVLILRKEFWFGPQTTDAQRLALVDHELCHGGVRCGNDGEPKVDAKGRRVYRLIKHDIEEFAAILYRHGPGYRRNLEDAFLAFMTRQKELELGAKKKRIDESDDTAKGREVLDKITPAVSTAH